MALDIANSSGVPDPGKAAIIVAETGQPILLDDCLQMHGGYGYIWEYPMCRAFADYRYMRIADGSNETLRELIARAL